MPKPWNEAPTPYGQCTKCARGHFGPPTFVHNERGGECLRYKCKVCGYTKTEPTADVREKNTRHSIKDGFVVVELDEPGACPLCGCRGLHFCTGKPMPPGTPKGWIGVRKSSYGSKMRT